MTGAPYQCAAATVGGWRRAKPIHVSTPGITIPTHLLRHPNTTNTLAHYYQPLQTERADGIKMVPIIRIRVDRLHLFPLEQKTLKNLYKPSKLFILKKLHTFMYIVLSAFGWYLKLCLVITSTPYICT